MVVVGGITRLTDSGLSMSDWSLIMGAIPPMSEAEWMAAFERYKEFPQYQQLNAGMSLAEFKTIFFWEYIHRLLGRLIGLVFLIPFAFFWIRGYFNTKMLRRAWILFGLGALQGAMGWIMVKSGLVDVPYVSHYRLAIHLLLAFVLFGFCVWYALDLQKRTRPDPPEQKGTLKKWAWGILAVFAIQVTWGAFTAGLNAGYMYNTFPLMNGEWLPQNAWSLQPVALNLVENPGTVQWMHRIVGTLLVILVVGLWWKTRRSGGHELLTLKARMLLGMILTQYVIGILTVITQVEIVTAVVHQAAAVVIWFLWLWYYHELCEKQAIE